MAVEYSWPSKEKAQAIGKRVKRLDGMDKSTGAAKYTYDVNLKNQLIAKGLGSPHAACAIKSIDTSAAEKVPGDLQIGREVETLVRMQRIHLPFGVPAKVERGDDVDVRDDEIHEAGGRLVEVVGEGVVELDVVEAA